MGTAIPVGKQSVKPPKPLGANHTLFTRGSAGAFIHQPSWNGSDTGLSINRNIGGGGGLRGREKVRNSYQVTFNSSDWS